MASAEPQTVITDPTGAAIFLVLTAMPGAARDDLRDVLADTAGLRRSVGFRIPEARLTCVTGLGADLWDRLFAAPRPTELHRLPEFAGRRHTAPSTPGDLLFHIRSTRFDLCFELAQRLTERLSALAQVVDEIHGFRSFDQRDLLGFVDGTENPEGDAARQAVMIGEEDVAFAGGSYVVVQKYVHDLAGWDALPVEEQERIVGRTKLSDLELADDVKPADSHVALNTIVGAAGEERQIVRYNMPFGRVGTGEFGTYFIGYARSPDVIETMLTRMFVGDEEGRTDRILDFSTAITGALFFVPSAAFLDDPPAPGPGTGAPGSAARAGDAGTTDTSTAGTTSAGSIADPGDGSLGIGSLKPSP
jgi:porphyrinogen peroxidase